MCVAEEDAALEARCRCDSAGDGADLKAPGERVRDDEERGGDREALERRGLTKGIEVLQRRNRRRLVDGRIVARAELDEVWLETGLTGEHAWRDAACTNPQARVLQDNRDRRGVERALEEVAQQVERSEGASIAEVHVRASADGLAQGW